MLDISVHAHVKQLERTLDSFAYQQMPFATARALTAIARHVQAAEQQNEIDVLDRPTPFTLKAIRVVGATKTSQEAVVYMMDTAAEYLLPYEFGGLNKLNSRALLLPVAAAANLNAFGNLPRNLLTQFKSRSDVFVGPVQTAKGAISGIWQRVTEEGGHATVQRGAKTVRTRKGLNTGSRLKLLVRFTDAHDVRQNLDWFGVAQATVDRTFNREMGRALAQAIASARR